MTNETEPAISQIPVQLGRLYLANKDIACTVEGEMGVAKLFR